MLTDVVTFGGLPFTASQNGVCNALTNIYFSPNTVIMPGHVSGTTAQLWVYSVSAGVMAYLRNQSIVSTEPINLQLVCSYETNA